MTRTVALFGFADETRDSIWDVADDTEIWSVNWAYQYSVPRIDRLFDVHLREVLTTNKTNEYPAHWEWLQKKHDYPIYMVEEFPEVPNCVPYPIEEITEDVFKYMDGDYWTSGMAYPFGMAIHERVDRIELYGVEMNRGTDVAYQRDGIALLAGIAMGRGIDVWRPEKSRFLRAKRYGFDGGQMIGRASVQEHLSHYKIDRELILAELNKVNGIVGERERIADSERHHNGRHKDAMELLDNARRKLNTLEEQLRMTIGAEQALEHLLEVADLQEPDLGLVSEVGQMEVEPV